MDNDFTQLEIRKFLKKLGINSQRELNKFIDTNKDMGDYSVSVNISVNDIEIFNFKDMIKVIK